MEKVAACAGKYCAGACFYLSRLQHGYRVLRAEATATAKAIEEAGKRQNDTLKGLQDELDRATRELQTYGKTRSEIADMDVAALHAQVDRVDGGEAFELLGQVLRFENEFAHGLSGLAARTLGLQT